MFLWNIAVTSLAEVWIEIEKWEHLKSMQESLPSRKCGLKFPQPIQNTSHIRHFPRGSVD